MSAVSQDALPKLHLYQKIVEGEMDVECLLGAVWSVILRKLGQVP